MSAAADLLIFGNAQPRGLEQSGFRDVSEASEHTRLGKRSRTAISQLHGGGAQALDAEDVGDSFDHPIVEDEAPRQTVCRYRGESPGPVIFELEGGKDSCYQEP